VTDGDHALSPEFAELGQHVVDAKDRAYANLVDIEERLDSVQDVAAIAVGQTDTGVDPAIKAALLSARAQASYDLDLLSAMARPLEQVQEHTGLIGLEGDSSVEEESAKDRVEKPQRDEPSEPSRLHDRARRRGLQGVADSLLELVITHDGQLERQDEDRSVLQTARKVLGLDNYTTIRGAARILENRGLITVLPVDEKSRLSGTYILNETALREAIAKGEISPTVLTAMAEHAKHPPTETDETMTGSDQPAQDIAPPEPDVQAAVPQAEEQDEGRLTEDNAQDTAMLTDVQMSPEVTDSLTRRLGIYRRGMGGGGLIERRRKMHRAQS
jgi:hypothetical protein